MARGTRGLGVDRVGPGVPCGAELPNLRHRVKPGAADQRWVASRGGKNGRGCESREAGSGNQAPAPLERSSVRIHDGSVAGAEVGGHPYPPTKTRQRIEHCREADRALRVSRREGSAARSRRAGRDLSLQSRWSLGVKRV